MRLKSLEYMEHTGEPEEWTLTGLTLGDINLLVGKNASGKTRILNIILHLAESIAGKLVPSPSGMVVQRQIFIGKSHLFFDNDGQQLEYELEVVEGKVIREVYTVDGESRLDRGPGGEGWILAVKEGKKVEFQTPDDQLAVVTRRDLIQHPYFEPLHQWANSLYHYAFSTLLGKDTFFVFIKSDNEKPDTLNAKDTSQVIDIYRRGKEVFGERYTDAVRQGFEVVGYSTDTYVGT